jgi:hypothetical protein
MKARAVEAGIFAALFLLGGACQNDSRVLDPSFASTSSLPHINNTDMAFPVALAGELVAGDCSNNPGPRITFEGTVELGGYGVRMIFRNNAKGTHERVEETAVDVGMLEAGEQIVIPKQPVLGGVGGNPFIWMQFVDGQGAALSGEEYLGRCVQGSWPITREVPAGASTVARFSDFSCENSPGPFISVASDLTVNAGVAVRFIFRNNDNPVGGPHKASATMSEVTLIPTGLSYHFPKQPVRGGVGGNPWIWAQFTDGAGASTTSETLLGRCEQLSKALG